MKDINSVGINAILGRLANAVERIQIATECQQDPEEWHDVEMECRAEILRRFELFERACGKALVEAVGWDEVLRLDERNKFMPEAVVIKELRAALSAYRGESGK